MPRPRKISKEILEAALAGLEERRRKVDEQIREVGAQLGGRRAPAAAAEGPRRRFSEATRRKMAAAQKRRWANVRKAAKKRGASGDEAAA
jgi:hypothetical protein